MIAKARRVPDEALVDGESRPVHRDRQPLPHHWPASLTGVLVFLAGIAALAWVFWQAYLLYTTPSDHLIQVGQKTLDLQELLRSTSAALIKIVLLVVMALAASIIAGKGVQLYWSGHRRD